jgi:hypothetical protein
MTMQARSPGGLPKTRLRRMHDVMAGHVENGSMPGLVTLVSRHGEIHVDAIGDMAIGGAPMQRDTIFRIASMTKPVTAVAGARAGVSVLPAGRQPRCWISGPRPIRPSTTEELLKGDLVPAAITSQIMLPAMSVPQNPIRLVDERWFDRWIPLATGSLKQNQTEIAMRFMVIVKADNNSEAGIMPSTELLTAMGKFNEEMVKAGVMLAGEGLHPSSKGARIKYSGKDRAVANGPFKATGDLVSGFWLVQVNSLDEAIEWMKRAPFDGGAEIEIRQVFDAEDFGEAVTPELREQEERLRAQAGKR